MIFIIKEQMKIMMITSNLNIVNSLEVEKVILLLCIDNCQKIKKRFKYNLDFAILITFRL